MDYAQEQTPALPFQRQLWLMQRMAPQVGLANISTHLHWDGPLDLALLQAATYDFVLRHPYMRTVIEAENNGSLFQRTYQAAPADILVKDIQHLPAGIRNKTAMSWIQEAAERPLPMDAQPCFRIVVARTDKTKHEIAYVFSHLTCDGLSTGILCKELLKAYTARLNAQQPKWIHDIPMDLLSRLHGQVNLSVTKETVDWRNLLPYRKPVSDQPRFKGRRKTFSVPAHLTKTINQLCRDHSISPFVCWLSLVQLTVERFCGEPKCRFDIVRSGRSSVDRRMVGPFFETVSMELESDRNVSFGELMKRNSELSDELKRIGPHKLPVAASRSQVLIDYQSELTPACLSNGVVVVPQELDNGAAIAELCFGIRRRKNRYSGHIKFDVELFDDALVDRMLEHLMHIASVCTTQPNMPLRHHELLPEFDRDVICLVNQTDDVSNFKAKANFVDESFAIQAAKSPDAPAITDNGQTINYGQLYSRSDVVAQILMDNGIGRGDHIGIAMRRGGACVICMLAVLKTGASYTPIDPEAPSSRNRSILEQVDVRFVIAERDELSSLDARVLLYCEMGQSSAHQRNANANFQGDRSIDDPAYTIFTSGSSGKPKGVEVTHFNVANFFAGIDTITESTNAGVWLSATKPTFDISVLELLWTVVNGFHVVIDTTRSLAESLADCVDSYGVTHFQCTPTLLQLIIKDQANLEALSQLRFLFVGGEVLPKTLAQQLAEFNNVAAFNMYGPSETTVWSSAWRIIKNEDVRIGAPLTNQQFLVLDRECFPVPVGVVGELYIGGDSVSNGYVGEPDLTSKSFLNLAAYGRVFRTGDLVRLHTDRSIEFVGRADNQIKVAGHRIELGEIETAILANAAVEKCVVLLRQGRLVALVVTGDPLTQKGHLLRHAAQWLPDYMVPNEVVIVDELPMNNSGKLDRNRAAEQLKLRVDTLHKQTETIRPTVGESQLRNRLIEIIEDQLRIQSLNVEKKWTDLGLSSLDIVGLVVRIENELDLAVPVAELFRSTSIDATLTTMTSQSAVVSVDSKNQDSTIEYEVGVI